MSLQGRGDPNFRKHSAPPKSRPRANMESLSRWKSWHAQKKQLKVATGRSFGEFPGNQPPSTANIVGYQLHTNKVVQTCAAERPRKWKKCDSLLKPGRLLPGFKHWPPTFNHNLWWQMDSNDECRSKPSSSILSTVYIYTCIHIYIYIDLCDALWSLKWWWWWWWWWCWWWWWWWWW